MTKHATLQLLPADDDRVDVVEAYCGAQAIESATQHQPDAILLM